MDELLFKTKVGKFIFFSNLALFGVLFIFYSLKGFDDEQFIDLLKLLAPINALYFTVLIKYILANKINIEVPIDKKPLSSLYKTVVKLMIYIHIISLLIIVTSKALFNLFEYNTMKNIVVLIETFFGAYIGFIMTSLFNIPENKENDI